VRRQADELRASRARIVEAGDAQRRRIERDLHDGAQQHLVALALSLRVARSQIEKDPDAAIATIDQAAEELSTATSELRELARGIHPAVLTDHGLAAALNALAGRSPVPVDMTDVLDARLCAEVESAAYFVVSEALTNVARYANAELVKVAVQRRNGTATVSVSDDGVGGAQISSGSGLRGIEDRVAALDGTLTIISKPGSGTTITAEMPCAS
jgi:signal transduction histidine kinase